MIILGIDPGTATTGFGVVKKINSTSFKLVDFGVITTKKNLTDAERLNVLSSDLSVLIKKYRPDISGVEKIFFTTNQKTVIQVAQSRGVILSEIFKQKIPILEFTPLEVKSTICGYGKADKKQVQFMVKKTLNLKTTPKPDDAADALAIALCAGYRQKSNTMIK